MQLMSVMPHIIENILYLCLQPLPPKITPPQKNKKQSIPTKKLAMRNTRLLLY